VSPLTGGDVNLPRHRHALPGWWLHAWPAVPSAGINRQIRIPVNSWLTPPHTACKKRSSCNHCVKPRFFRGFFAFTAVPRSAPRPCRSPGCIRMAGPGGYCADHVRPRPGTFADRDRGSSAARGYGYRWRQLRAHVMARDGGLCQVCLLAGVVRPATDVDHIIRKAAGGSDDPSNLQAICGPCHKAKTAREHCRAPA
jgi:5-methylcytosine-specific restriction protein A